MPDWISDLRLPELVQFSYDVANPAHVDLIVDLIELVALKLLDHMNSVNVFKVAQCLGQYIRSCDTPLRGYDQLSDQTFVISTLSALIQPASADSGEQGHNLLFTGGMRHRTFRLAAQTGSKKSFTKSLHHHHPTPFNFDIEFDLDQYRYLFGANEDTLLTIRNWWWRKRSKRGFLQTLTGREIVQKCGCILRFLIHHQSDSVMSDYRSVLFTMVAEQIKNRIVYNRDGYLNRVMIKYVLFDQCPFLVDDELIDEIVQSCPELYFHSEHTLGVKLTKVEPSWEEVSQTEQNPWSDVEDEEDSSGWDNISCRATTSSIRIESDSCSDLDIIYQSSGEDEIPTGDYFDQIPGKFAAMKLQQK